LAKNLKISVKNSKLAEALNVNKLKLAAAGKKKIAEKKTDTPPIDAEETQKKPKARVVRKKKVETKVEKVSSPIKKETPKKETEKKATLSKEKPAPKKKKEEEKLGPVLTPRKTEPIKKKETLLPKVEKKQETQPEQKQPTKETSEQTEKSTKPAPKQSAFKEFKEFKATRKKTSSDKSFDSRDRMGLREGDDEKWRKRKAKKKGFQTPTQEVTRPKNLKVKSPITIKDLAAAMKLKASELISKLFLQGILVTLNDSLSDETTIQLLGQEFNCEIEIDTSEEEKLQITNKSILEEINETDENQLKQRPPIIAFMGHVDHGKTSLIDAIRHSNIASGEAGAITQHIGAFTTNSNGQQITILDTPGHEAFSEMRMRGASATDIVILVIAGDEGIREQTIEALTQAKEAKVPIIVAINKSDKEGYDTEKIYRQLSDHNLLPEAWGGEIITVNCSALTKQGIPDLLEMVTLQAEILELKANPESRARGTILESEMHKGFGAIATALIQNGTLKLNDPIVFGAKWGRIKTMHDEKGNPLKIAPPSTPVRITGLSGLAEAGQEFIVVQSEKEARKLAQGRKEGYQRRILQSSKPKSLEALMQKQDKKKSLSLILRADVQGSLEALKNSLLKIKSKKVELNIISETVGQISESDIELAAASNAIIVGFHTQIETHADSLLKQLKVSTIRHDVIYHIIDDVKEQMVNILDKIEQETPKGKAEIIAVFKSSQLGLIAGCKIVSGTIHRNHMAKLVRKNEIIWKGKIQSIKREKEDVKEVQKGLECGILLQGFSDYEIGDEIESFEITYLKQEL